MVRKRVHPYVIVALVFILSLPILFTVVSLSGDKETYKNISVDEFAQLAEEKDFVLINTHVPYEGEIPGTDLLIPFNAVGAHRGELPEDRDTRIVVYCMTGPMGRAAAKKLAALGYSNVLHLEGGMRAWKRAGGKLEFRSL